MIFPITFSSVADWTCHLKNKKLFKLSVHMKIVHNKNVHKKNVQRKMQFKVLISSSHSILNGKKEYFPFRMPLFECNISKSITYFKLIFLYFKLHFFIFQVFFIFQALFFLNQLYFFPAVLKPA